jgi:hypothetical protein
MVFMELTCKFFDIILFMENFSFPSLEKPSTCKIGSPLKIIVTFFIVSFFLLQDPLVTGSFMNYSSLA